MIKGKVFKIESKDYYVLLDEGGKIRCNLRGKFKKQFGMKKDKLFALDVAIVGDSVTVSMNDDGTGTITGIDERRNYLSRKAPKVKGASYRGERLEQIIASNFDNLFVVSSTVTPLFNNKVIDRILVAGESSNIESAIVINKIDLDKEREIDRWVELYENIGYKVFLTSAKNKTGIDELRNRMKGKTNLFWGQSGVGKSSLFNSLYDLDFNIGEISTFSNKGKHTTVTSILLEVEEGTFIIDTPGVREIDPYGIKKEDLGHHFVDIKNYLNDCKFNTCTHLHEPGCAVLEAVENGDITEERFESYLRLLDSIEDDMIF